MGWSWARIFWDRPSWVASVYWKNTRPFDGAITAWTDEGVGAPPAWMLFATPTAELTSLTARAAPPISGAWPCWVLASFAAWPASAPMATDCCDTVEMKASANAGSCR